MLFLAMLSSLSLLLTVPLLSPQHRLFLQRNWRMRSVALLSSPAARGECGQSLYSASWKMCIPLKWSAEGTYLEDCSSLPCCTALKLWNACSLILPGIWFSSAKETQPAAVIQGVQKSKDSEDGSVRFVCSLGYLCGSGSNIWSGTKDHLGTQR